VEAIDTIANRRRDQPDHWCYRRNRFSDESARFERRVEAARAGDAGRGFAVVAWKSVRSLSARRSGEGDQGADFGVMTQVENRVSW